MRGLLNSTVSIDRGKEPWGSSVSLQPWGRINALETDEVLEIFLVRESGRQRGFLVFISDIGSTINSTFSSGVSTKSDCLLALVPITRQSNETLWVPPVLAAASSLDSAEAQALEHSALLLVWVILLAAAAELIAEVVVVLVARGRFLGVDALSAGNGVFA